MSQNIKITDIITACAKETWFSVNIDLCRAVCLNEIVLKDVSAVIFDQALWLALMGWDASAYGKHYLEEDELLLYMDASCDDANKQEMGGTPSIKS